MSTQTTLTPEEQALIELRREQQALQQREQVIQQELELQELINRANKKVQDLVEYLARQVSAAKQYKDQLGEGWVLHVDTIEKVEEVKRWNSKTAMYDLLKTIPYTFTQAYITKDRYRVEVVEHIHYPKYSVRGETQGFKMQLSGSGVDYRYESKYLSSAKTVNTKVDELIKARQVKEQGELTIEQATQTHLTNLTLSFPDATIVAKQDYDRVRLSRGGYDYINYQSISVTLRNGIEVKYEVLTSGALRRRSINLTPGFTSQYPTHEELLTKLNSI